MGVQELQLCSWREETGSRKLLLFSRKHPSQGKIQVVHTCSIQKRTASVVHSCVRVWG